MKKRITFILSCFFAFNLITVLFCSPASSDTWENIKRKTRDTKNITKLKMKRSKYENKIEERYGEIGKLIYNKLDLNDLVSKEDRSAARLIKRIDDYNRKIEAIEKAIKAIGEGEEITAEDIEDIDAGIGLDDESIDDTDPDLDDPDLDDLDTSAEEEKEEADEIIETTPPASDEEKKETDEEGSLSD